MKTLISGVAGFIGSHSAVRFLMFVADITKARQELAWSPDVTPQVGVRRLVDWVQSSQDLLQSVLNN